MKKSMWVLKVSWAEELAGLGIIQSIMWEH